MIRVLLVLTIMMLPGAAMAGSVLDMSSFAQIPVLHEGRIKPMDSFARAELQQIAGGHAPAGMTPVSWLAETLFDPARAAQRNIFVLREPGLSGQLGLKVDKTVYSLQDLAPGLAATEKLLPALAQQKPDRLTSGQRALLDLHGQAAFFTRILGSLGMILPLEGSGSSYLDLKKDEAGLKKKLAAIVSRKGENIDSYSAEEQALALSGLQMAVLESEAVKPGLFRIIPPQWTEQDWLTPWESLDSGYGSPWSAHYLALWQTAAQAYRAGDAGAWHAAVEAIHGDVQTQAGGSVSWNRLRAETIFHKIKPFFLAQVFYGAAFILLAVFLRTGRSAFQTAAIGVSFAAAIVHAAGIAARIYILSRPPVGTLFESILFVALVIFSTAAAASYARRDAVILLFGLAAAALLLMLAPVFAPNGDSLEMLVAVLNTNFWLATHVIFITAGYGVCVLAALLGHAALYGRTDPAFIKTLHRILIAGLFLTATGTMLGGIWADQSWGRFWGWDPKENGALLIVLWIAWVFHGRMGGFFSQPAYFAAVSFLAVIVSLSWFGVNLLSVGLHSYGFTSGMAAGLLSFCLLESAVIGTGWFRARMRCRSAHAV